VEGVKAVQKSRSKGVSQADSHTTSNLMVSYCRCWQCYCQ